jgi:hypothetical protein
MHTIVDPGTIGSRKNERFNDLLKLIMYFLQSPCTRTPTFVKYRPDKDKMAEISEEGDKPDDVIKKEGEVEQVVVEEKTDEVVAVETPSTAKDEVTNDVCVMIIILSYREKTNTTNQGR